MRHLLCLLTVGLLLTVACDPCKNLDCITGNTLTFVQLVSRETGEDLVFGPTALYEPEELLFYAIHESETVKVDYQPIRHAGGRYDSLLQINFENLSTTVYLKLNEQDTDTLQLSYETRQTRCCGTITDIRTISYNNQAPVPFNHRGMELKK